MLPTAGLLEPNVVVLVVLPSLFPLLHFPSGQFWRSAPGPTETPSWLSRIFFQPIWDPYGNLPWALTPSCWLFFYVEAEGSSELRRFAKGRAWSCVLWRGEFGGIDLLVQYLREYLSFIFCLGFALLRRIAGAIALAGCWIAGSDLIARAVDSAPRAGILWTLTALSDEDCRKEAAADCDGPSESSMKSNQFHSVFLIRS
jgi:hypothetical protein